MRPDLHSERYGLLTSWYRSSQPTDARATGLVCIAVAVPFWASRPRFELTKAKSVRYLFPMFGPRGAHIAVIAEHEHHIEAQRLALRGRSETCVRDSRVRHSSGWSGYREEAVSHPHRSAR